MRIAAWKFDSVRSSDRPSKSRAKVVSRGLALVTTHIHHDRPQGTNERELEDVFTADGQVIDNSGAVIAECINVLKVKTRQLADGKATVGEWLSVEAEKQPAQEVLPSMVTENFGSSVL